MDRRVDGGARSACWSTIVTCLYLRGLRRKIQERVELFTLRFYLRLIEDAIGRRGV